MPGCALAFCANAGGGGKRRASMRCASIASWCGCPFEVVMGRKFPRTLAVTCSSGRATQAYWTKVANAARPRAGDHSAAEEREAAVPVRSFSGFLAAALLLSLVAAPVSARRHDPNRT